MNTKIGTCCICAEEKPLTFEHVPPQNAFNKRPIKLSTPQQAMGKFIFQDIQGRTNQRGSGKHTLCGQCNSQTGRWYVPEYTRWAHDAAHLLWQSNGDPSLYHQYVGYPLRFFKQIVTMFMSVSGGALTRVYPGLRSYLLSPCNREFDNSTFRIYAYYNPGPGIRQLGNVLLCNIFNNSTKSFSELASFPFGFVLAENSRPPSMLLEDITFLSDYAFNDIRSLSLRLRSFPVVSGVPGQYFTPQQIEGLIANNEGVASLE